MKKRLPVVGVMGSGDEAHADKAGELGRWLAGQGVHLLTGAGRGVMTSVSEAFASVGGREGLVVGIVPCGDEPVTPREGYPNPFIELAIFTHLSLSGITGTDPRSRNHINVLSSNVLVALPGGSGTSSEVVLALRYGKPIAAYVDAPTDIPDLPDAVPVLRTLAEVQQFVLRALGRD